MENRFDRFVLFFSWEFLFENLVKTFNYWIFQSKMNIRRVVHGCHCRKVDWRVSIQISTQRIVRKWKTKHYRWARKIISVVKHRIRINGPCRLINRRQMMAIVVDRIVRWASNRILIPVTTISNIFINKNRCPAVQQSNMMIRHLSIICVIPVQKQWITQRKFSPIELVFWQFVHSIAELLHRVLSPVQKMVIIQR